MEIVSNLLFWISNGLLVPVIVGLLFFFIRSVFMLGNFYNTYMKRQKFSRKAKQLISNFTVETDAEEMLQSLSELPQNALTDTVKDLLTHPYNEAYNAKVVSEYEITMDKTLGKSKLLTKFGPILGLMGTLIPMGPALVGLSTGDIGSMAHNMQVAFATTVIGLLIGAIGYVILQIMQRWANTDLIQLDYITEVLREKNK